MQIPRILIVDDEPTILKILRIHLREHYDIYTAESGLAGLQAIEEHGPFAVIISDLQMPGMDGNAFLRKTRDIAPQSVRVMLTAQTDFDVAVDAVNEGQVFRFISKPFDNSQLLAILDSAAAQYQLVIAERELLTKTLTGSVDLLTELLSMLDSTTSAIGSRASKLAVQIGDHLSYSNTWEVKLAALLSQLGRVTLPLSIQQKVATREPLSDSDQALFDSHANIGARLIMKIPRLQNLAEVVRRQNMPYSELANSTTDMSGYILRIALDFIEQSMLLGSEKAALKWIDSCSFVYHPKVLEAIKVIKSVESAKTVVSVPLRHLSVGSIVAGDICDCSGKLLVKSGYEVSSFLLERLAAFARSSTGVREPIQVFADLKSETKPAASMV